MIKEERTREKERERYKKRTDTRNNGLEIGDRPRSFVGRCALVGGQPCVDFWMAICFKQTYNIFHTHTDTSAREQTDKTDRE